MRTITDLRGTLIDPCMLPYSLSSHGSRTSITNPDWDTSSFFTCSYDTSIEGWLEVLKFSNEEAPS